MSRAAWTLAAVLLGGCAGGYAPPAVVEATYRCDGGVVLPARFDNRAGVVELTLPSGARVTLTQQRAASGIWYASAGFELRGKGREATITLPGGAPLSCASNGERERASLLPSREKSLPRTCSGVAAEG